MLQGRRVVRRIECWRPSPCTDSLLPMRSPQLSIEKVVIFQITQDLHIVESVVLIILDRAVDAVLAVERLGVDGSTMMRVDEQITLLPVLGLLDRQVPVRVLDQQRVHHDLMEQADDEAEPETDQSEWLLSVKHFAHECKVV